MPALGCAIYTRKSSEEGLEQDFNSLHAQREACEAFVLSQKGLGWTPIATAYDDVLGARAMLRSAQLGEHQVVAELAQKLLSTRATGRKQQAK